MFSISMRFSDFEMKEIFSSTFIIGQPGQSQSFLDDTTLLFFFCFVGKTNFWHCLFCSCRLQILYMILNAPLWWGENSTLFKIHLTTARRAKMLQFTNIRKCCWSKLAALGDAGSAMDKGRPPSNLQPHLSYVQSQNPLKSLLLNSNSPELSRVSYWFLSITDSNCGILKGIIICTVFKGKWKPAFVIAPRRAIAKTCGLKENTVCGSSILLLCSWYLE